MKQNPSISDFPSEMVTACNAAMDAAAMSAFGFFSTDDFEAFVIEHMGGFGCDAVLMKIVDEDSTHPDYDDVCHETYENLKLAVTAAPRGHYAIIRTATENHETVYQTVISDGHSDAPSSSEMFGCYDILRSGDEILERMVGLEIYSCHRLLEDKRESDLCFAAIKNYGLYVGYTHKGSFGVNGKKYSTVTISEIDKETGRLTLLMIKKGSRKRFVIDVGPLYFIGEANLDEQRKEAEASTLKYLSKLIAA